MAFRGVLFLCGGPLPAGPGCLLVQEKVTNQQGGIWFAPKPAEDIYGSTLFNYSTVIVCPTKAVYRPTSPPGIKLFSFLSLSR